MQLDIAVLAFVGLFAVFGLFSGAIRQLGHWSGLIVAGLTSRTLGAMLGPIAAAKFGYPPLLASIGCTFAAFFLIYVLTAALTRMLLQRVFPEGERGALNRVGGLVLGGGKAALVCFVLLSGLVFLEKPVLSHIKGARKLTSGSLAMTLARKYNAFSSLPQVEGLSKVAEASRDPEAAAKLAEDPAYKKLAKDPRVRALASDASIVAAAERGDTAALIANPKFLELLNDPRLAEQLTQVGAQ